MGEYCYRGDHYQCVVRSTIGFFRNSYASSFHWHRLLFTTPCSGQCALLFIPVFDYEAVRSPVNNRSLPLDGFCSAGVWCVSFVQHFSPRSRRFISLH